MDTDGCWHVDSCEITSRLQISERSSVQKMAIKTRPARFVPSTKPHSTMLPAQPTNDRRTCPEPRADVTKQRQLGPKESIHNLLFSGLLQCDGSSDRSGKGRVHVATSKPPVYPKMLSPGFSICLHVAPSRLALSLSPPARVHHRPSPSTLPPLDPIAASG